ncbi:MAG: DNA repair protein RecN [Prolixibacteraceae bacterium]|nr:DNA repair protein RecN [Prolixibacteraceae bacterium]
MLLNLTIKNYALIRELNVDFAPGLTVVTGETGAGKSIILGALALILGQRADLSVLQDADKKCVVEGAFEIPERDSFEPLFSKNGLDYQNPVIFRREISPQGKSRAFINDTPVQLPLMRELGLKLIDIHSQHSNLELGSRLFQLNVIDWYGGHSEILNQYKSVFRELKAKEAEYNELKERAAQANADLDYHSFQFEQLDTAKLVAGEQEELEEELKVLNHSEEIKTGLGAVYQSIDGDVYSSLAALRNAQAVLKKLSSFFPPAENMLNRLDSQYLEIRDIAEECEQLAEKTENDPRRLEYISERLNTLYSLQQKHRVSSVEELIFIRDEFDLKIQAAKSFEEDIKQLQEQVSILKHTVGDKASELHEARVSVIPEIEREITAYLEQLGMPHATFKIELHGTVAFTPQGTDEAWFLFSANKGVRAEEINKVASGGELSRLMLAIKSVVARSKALPAIVFDEIDSGISGGIAVRMGEILKAMSEYMQVINITHLPQIASKGKSHFRVFKKDTGHRPETGMRLLSEDQRVEEIAIMLSGNPPTPEAIANAKAMLGNLG